MLCVPWKGQLRVGEDHLRAANQLKNELKMILIRILSIVVSPCFIDLDPRMSAEFVSNYEFDTLSDERILTAVARAGNVDKPR